MNMNNDKTSYVNNDHLDKLVLFWQAKCRAPIRAKCKLCHELKGPVLKFTC